MVTWWHPVARSCSETIFIAPCFSGKENLDYPTFFQGPNLDYQNTRTRVCMIEGICHTGEICIHCRKVCETNHTIHKQDMAEKFQVVIWINEYSPKQIGWYSEILVTQNPYWSWEECFCRSIKEVKSEIYGKFHHCVKLEGIQSGGQERWV